MWWVHVAPLFAHMWAGNRLSYDGPRALFFVLTKCDGQEATCTAALTWCEASTRQHLYCIDCRTPTEEDRCSAERTRLQLWEWDRQRWKSYTGEPTGSGIKTALSKLEREEVDDVMQQAVQWFDIVEENARSLELTSRSSGSLNMLTDQMPIWFECTSYTVTMQTQRVTTLIQDFIHQQPQQQYILGGKWWRLDWRLISVNSSEVVFVWRSKGLAERDTQEHMVRLISASPPAGPRIVRECDLPRGGAKPPLAPQEEANGGKLPLLKLTSDSDLVYDYMRYRFLEWADFIEEHVRSYLESPRSSSAGPAVVADPMCGAGWFTLLIKARLGDSVDVVCSDYSSSAVASARASFAANSMSGTFLVGDLFEPIRANQIRPQFIYVYPPQGDATTLGITTAHDKELLTPGTKTHFFARMAEELPPLIDSGALLFVGVDFPILHEVIQIFEDAGWELLEGGVPSTVGQDIRSKDFTRTALRVQHASMLIKFRLKREHGAEQCVSADPAAAANPAATTAGPAVARKTEDEASDLAPNSTC